MRKRGSRDGDAERLIQGSDNAASSAVIPTTSTTGAQEAALVGAAAPTVNGQSDFDYRAVSDDIVDGLCETAAQIRNRRRDYVIQTGQDLLAWRDQLKPGQFHRWIEQECQLEVRTAQLAMMVARFIEGLGEQERENFSRLPMAVQYQLAAPSVPDFVREEVLGALADGKSYKIDEVKQLVRGAQSKKDRPVVSSQRGDGKVAAREDEREAETKSEVGPVDEQAASSAREAESQPALVQSGLEKVQKSVRVISQSKLDATTPDQSKQALIKDIFALANQIAPALRETLISGLSKLDDITAKQLAECLQ